MYIFQFWIMLQCLIQTFDIYYVRLFVLKIWYQFFHLSSFLFLFFFFAKTVAPYFSYGDLLDTLHRVLTYKLACLFSPVYLFFLGIKIFPHILKHCQFLDHCLSIKVVRIWNIEDMCHQDYIGLLYTYCWSRHCVSLL